MAPKRKNTPRNATKNPPKATKTNPNSTSSTSRANAAINYMGCTLTDVQKKRWRALTLPNRIIKVTKFFDRDVFRQLGILEAVEVLLRRAGLSEFLNKRAETYRKLTLEFLSTVKKERKCLRVTP